LQVREIVRNNVSNHDIALVLHNFDMDVARTINAFTTGSIDTALGEWERNGVSTKKNKKSKKKANAGGDGSSAATSTTTETPKLSSVSTPRHEPAPPAAAVTKTPIAVVQPPPTPTTTVQSDERKVDELAHLLREMDSKIGHQRTAIQHLLTDKAALGSLAANATFSHHAASVIKAIEKLGAFLPEIAKNNGFIAPPVPQQNGKPAHNGKPQANGASPVIKHAVSQSSLASSAGEDSGLGQISPVSQGLLLINVGG
jgi:hypothetical protein